MDLSVEDLLAAKICSGVFLKVSNALMEVPHCKSRRVVCKHGYLQ